MKKYKLLFYGVIFFILAIEVVVFLDNFIFKYLVDKGSLFVKAELTGNLFGKLIAYAVLLFFGLKILDGLLWYIKLQLINKLESKLMNDIEKRSFWHIINLSSLFHLNKRTGSLISQFTRGINKVESFVDAFIFHFVPVVFRIIISISVILYFDKVTAITLLVMTALFILIGVILTNMQKIPQNMANYREDVLKQNLADVFFNMETVKYFAKEKRTFNYFSTLSGKLKEARVNFWKYFSWHALLQTVVLGLGIAVIFYFSFMGLKEGRLTLGSITLIYAAVWKLIPQLFGLIHGYREFIRSIVDVDALFKVFKEKNEVVDKVGAKELLVREGEIEFEEVSFAYPRKNLGLI